MAYTYDQFEAEARKAGLFEKFSQGDIVAAQRSPEYGVSLLGLMKDLGNATTGEQRLLTNESINRLRRSYGVTNSVAEPKRLLLPEQSGTLDATDPTTYKAVLNDLINQKEFSYNPETDPAYAEYLQAYRREGQRASANALAQAAAMTGGRPSSYAINAAQQAGNYYAAQAADMIPTLRQNAYAEYLKNLEAKKAIAGLLSGGEGKNNEGDGKTSKIYDFLSGLGGGAQQLLGSIGTGLTEAKNGVTDWLKGLWGNDQKEEPATEYKITNNHTDSWVEVDGKQLSYEKLIEMIRTGEVIQRYNPDSKTYTYISKPPNGSIINQPEN